MALPPAPQKASTMTSARHLSATWRAICSGVTENQLAPLIRTPSSNLPRSQTGGGCQPAESDGRGCQSAESNGRGCPPAGSDGRGMSVRGVRREGDVSPRGQTGGGRGVRREGDVSRRSQTGGGCEPAESDSRRMSARGESGWLSRHEWTLTLMSLPVYNICTAAHRAVSARVLFGFPIFNATIQL